MIFANSGTRPRHQLSPLPDAEPAAANVVWLDLYDATEEERAFTERVTGLRVPAQAELAEIERSSRLSMRNGVLTMNTPMISRRDGQLPVVAPLGFVVSPGRLLTVRSTPIAALDAYAENMYEEGAPAPTGIETFVGVLEAIVDRLADVLESAGTELDTISRQVFRPEMMSVRQMRRESAIMQQTLRAIGEAGDLLSRLRDSVVGSGRIATYASESAAAWIPAELLARLTTVRQDIASLNDYDVQITGKVQFLLDATLGFINIQQNNVMKLLTVASIVGIPPVLIAGIYGMNFKNMPELSWGFGYAYGLGVILVSAILPLWWFWRRGWI